MDKLEQLYFIWLVEQVCDNYEIQDYSDLLHRLYDTKFYADNEFDQDIAVYGVDLRGEFLNCSPVALRYSEIYGEMGGNCNILELMIAISNEIEYKIMTNSEFGDRISEWFWGMIASLGLINYDNSHYNESEVDEILSNFIEKRYESDGHGGLFTINDPDFDVRDMTIWAQAMHYLSEIAIKNGEIF